MTSKCAWCDKVIEGKPWFNSYEQGQFCSYDCASEAESELTAKYADYGPGIHQ